MPHPLDFLVDRSAVVIPTVWDVGSASAARVAGAEALLLSGSALASTMGLPDLGLVDRHRIVDASECIVRSVGLPLLVDIDDGLGSPARLGRLVEALASVGAVGVMLEDVAYPGAGALCDPAEMVARLKVVRSAGAGAVKVLARTDVLGPSWPFSETMRRLGSYLDAGADWVMPAFVRSNEEHWAAARLAAPRAMSMPEAGGVPSVAESAAAGYCAAIVSAHASLHRMLTATYAAVLKGDTEAILAASEPWRNGLLKADRFDEWLDLGRAPTRPSVH